MTYNVGDWVFIVPFKVYLERRGLHPNLSPNAISGVLEYLGKRVLIEKKYVNNLNPSDYTIVVDGGRQGFESYLIDVSKTEIWKRNNKLRGMLK